MKRLNKLSLTKEIKHLAPSSVSSGKPGSGKNLNISYANTKVLSSEEVTVIESLVATFNILVWCLNRFGLFNATPKVSNNFRGH